jgi:DNA-binding NtrC family response regulator
VVERESSIVAADEAPQKQQRQVLRVLMVEDLADDAMLVLLELGAAWDVIHHRVQTGPAMMAALDLQPWDIIISDFAMPRFSGLQALAIARERANTIPFILISGTVGEEVAVEAMKAGANDYLFKGNLKRLAPAVQRELREAAGRREARRIEQELQKRDEQLAEAQRLARLGNWFLDARNKTVVWSDETYRIFGRAPGTSALPLETFLNCLQPDDRRASPTS